MEQERIRGLEEEEEEIGGNSWEDMEKQVEEKWPIVTKEMRTIVLKQGNVIYGHAALHRDVAHHGNHWKTKCIFDYLYK